MVGDDVVDDGDGGGDDFAQPADDWGVGGSDYCDDGDFLDLGESDREIAGAGAAGGA
jgi:hypothetical protein